MGFLGSIEVRDVGGWIPKGEGLRSLGYGRIFMKFWEFQGADDSWWTEKSEGLYMGSLGF